MGRGRRCTSREAVAGGGTSQAPGPGGVPLLLGREGRGDGGRRMGLVGGGCWVGAVGWGQAVDRP